ncbi:MAG: hypothetical protein AMXMBFR47_19390 [Planctomycetota bacterium]
MDERSRHRQFEEQFLAQLRARSLALLRKTLPADVVMAYPTGEGIDSVRAELSRLGVYDRDATETLAGTRSLEVFFKKKRLGGLFHQAVSRIRVRVLAPIEPLLKGERPGAVGREEVLDALARYELLPRRDRPTGIIFASATGFSPEARALAEGSGFPTLVLMGGREDGGWDVAMPQRVRNSPWARLFELESQDDRLRRLFHHLNSNAHLVDSRGLSMRELSDKLGLPRGEVEQLVRQACRTEPRLMTVVHEGSVHIARTPLAEEGSPMGMWSRVRKLLGFKPSVAERVREMTIQRVRIEQERHEVDQKTEILETQEREALKNGAEAKSDAERKQIAGKLVRVRTELKRFRAQAQNLTNALDVIGTHIHHLTLAEQNKRLELPKAEDLTREAATAEQTAAELAANAELARSIEVGAATPMMEEEMSAIFEEFKQAADEKATSQAGSKAGEAAAAPTAGSQRDSRQPATPDRAPAARSSPPPVPEKREARPEVS